MVYKVKEETITGIANAIRTKTNSEEDIRVEDFAEEILNIETGENTVSAAQSARDAEASAVSAASSAQDAAESAAAAAASANDSFGKADEAKEWAVGETGSAKYYADEAAKEAESAHGSWVGTFEIANYVAELKSEVENTISTAQGFEAEAWAVGTKNKIAVTNTDPQYNNNAKYYYELAKAIQVNLSDLTIAGNTFVTASLPEPEVTS